MMTVSGSRTTNSANDRVASAAPSRWLVILSHVPLPIMYVLATALAAVALVVPNARLKAIDDNFSKAFPDLNAMQRRRLVRTFVHNFADITVETIRAYSIEKDELNKRVHIKNIDVLDRFVEANQSIVLLGSHEANWEWVGLACSYRLPFAMEGAHKPLRPAGLHTFMHKMRTRFGASLFTPEQAARALIEGRKKRRAISFIVDEKPSLRDECHWVKFLNQETAFRSSFEKIARQWRYPVVFASRRRTSRGHYEVTFEVLGEPPYDSPPFQLVERYAQALQNSIIANPADWLWTQRRWTIKKPFYA